MQLLLTRNIDGVASRPFEINMEITRVHISDEHNFGTRDATANLKLQPYLLDFEIKYICYFWFECHYLKRCDESQSS